MASSKKYGYQLRGEKLSLVELDLTGSGSGLNYTHTEGDGLDITTDPSAWKSPLEAITNGLQIEYLSNEPTLYVPMPFIFNIIPLDNSRMNNIDWLHTTDSDFEAAIVSNILYPLTLSKVTVAGQQGIDTNALKVVYTENADAASDDIPVGNVFYTDSYDIKKGSKYLFSMDIKFNCNANMLAPGWMGSIPWTCTLMPFYDTDFHFEQNSGSDFAGLNASSNLQNINVLGTILHPDSIGSNSSLNTGWATVSFDFIANHDKIGFTLNPFAMEGTTDDNIFALFDNIELNEVGNEEISDISESELNLPSYAQKALLDYVRAQQFYESGNMQKWDFFMKQFRSKLERWEDSRITGPRVLGPSSSAIR